jgi:type IV pilus assembly protein PilF
VLYLKTIMGRILLGACALVLAGCVTTTERVFTEPPAPEKALERRVQLARQYIGEGNWPDAKRNLKMAADIDPNNAEVQEAFGLVYQSTGEYELAEESFKNAIRLQSDFSRARNNYAAFLYSQERYREAEAQLNYVVKDSLYSGRPRAFINLGLCQVKLFKPVEAEASFVRALSMDRTNSIALLEVAQLRFDAGDYPNANRYYGTYRTVVRQQSARGLWLGVRIAQAGGNKDAVSSYALALENMYPKSAEYQAYQRSLDGS